MPKNPYCLGIPGKKSQTNAERCYKRLLPHPSTQVDTILGPIGAD